MLCWHVLTCAKLGPCPLCGAKRTIPSPRLPGPTPVILVLTPLSQALSETLHRWRGVSRGTVRDVRVALCGVQGCTGDLQGIRWVNMM